MPRLPRVHLENALYFVSMEGPYREQIFKDQADRRKYMELLSKNKTEQNFKLFSYALLEDRLHLLIEADEQFPISQIMQKMTPLYTKYFNGRYGRKGPLFQKRFRSVMVEKDAYLPRLTRYIHMTSPDYFNTSYGVYVPQRERNFDEPVLDLQAEVEETLRLLPDGNGKNAYERFMASADKQEFELLDKKLSRGFFLGSDQFISEAKKKMEEQSHREAVIVDEKDNSFAKPPIFSISGKTAVLSGLLVATICLSVFSVYLRQESFVMLVRTMALASRPAVEQPAVKPLNPKAVTLRQSVGLNDTIWEVELISVSPEGVQTPVKDKIKFQGEAFESYYFARQGFSPSNYTVTVNENGVITWETIQRNAKGEVVSWRGDWNGKQMEGVLSYRPEGRTARDFSFMSNRFLGAQK